MSKMHYFNNKCSKIAKRWDYLNSPQRPLSFNIGDLKFRDLATLWFFKPIMTKSNFKNIVMTYFSDVITITSPISVTIFSNMGLTQSNFLTTSVVVTCYQYYV